MADFWKSQARKFCDFCKCWIADNKPSVEFHENGRKHKENITKRIKEMHKNSAKQAKQQAKFDTDMEKMEKAAMAAYLKDVEGDNRDIMADKMIQDKLKQPGDSRKAKEEPCNWNRMPDAAPEAHPRFRDTEYYIARGAADIDPLDPFAKQKLTRLEAREKAKTAKLAAKEAAKSEAAADEGKGKSGKGAGKKSKGEASASAVPIRKVWYEARAQGHSYYWNIETNQSIWEPPLEGFMSLAEQAEEAKEQTLQQEFFTEIEEAEKVEKAKIFEEQRANMQREKLKEIRKKFEDSKKAERQSEVKDDEESEEEKIPYRRDYSVPEKPQPYGSWQVVKKVETPFIDLQLPKVKKPVAPTITFSGPPPPQRVFKEKTITHITTGNSDDEGATVSFKKRKLGSKNVRKRTDD